MEAGGQAVAGLDPAPASDQARARQALLALLTDETDPRRAGALAEVVAWLDPGPQDRVQARWALLAALADETYPLKALGLAEAVARLDPSAQDRARAWQVLLAACSPPRRPGWTRPRRTGRTPAGRCSPCSPTRPIR